MVAGCGRPHVARGLCRKHYGHVHHQGRLQELPAVTRPRGRAGTSHVRIPAALTRQHVKMLLAAGATLGGVAEAAQVPLGAVDYLINGSRVRRGRALPKTVAATHAERLLRVRPQHINTRGLVPARGVARRLQALTVIGYSQHELARRLQVTATQIGYWIHQRDQQVWAATHDRVSRLYEAICMRPLTGTASATRARRYAAAAGWIPPLGGDDIDTDEMPPTGDSDSSYELLPQDYSPLR